MINTRALLRLVASVLGVATLSACGAGLGDMGAADQARNDLNPVEESGGGARVGRTTTTQPSRRCVLVVDDIVTDQGTCPLDTAATSAVIAGGSWRWIDNSTGTVMDGPAAGATGAWVWVTSRDEVVQRRTEGGWFWVSAGGAVGTSPTRDGGWYWLTSPDQVSTTPRTGAIPIVTPGTNASSGTPWYFVPSGETAPVFGGSGPQPVSPTVAIPSVKGPEPATDAGSGTEESSSPGVNPCAEQRPIIESNTTLNGWADDGTCRTRFTWSTTGRVVTEAGRRFVISGSVLKNEVAPSDPIAIDIYVSRDDQGVESVTAVNSSVPLISGAGSVQVVPDTRCAGRGVQAMLLDPQRAVGTVTWNLLLCDEQLATFVDGP